MRNFALPLFVAAVVTVMPYGAKGWTADQVDFPGDWNGWSLTTPTTKYTGPDGFAEWFRMVAAPASNVNPFNFKMVTGNDWNQDYGGNLAFAKNTWDIMYYQPLSDTASQLSGGAQAGKKYIFTTKDPGLANTFISIQEISADPVDITSVSGPTGAGYLSGSTVSIRVKLSAQPSPEEKVYVRFTKDNFTTYGIASSTLAVETNITESQIGFTTTLTWVATAQITNLANNANYVWYVLTSTASKTHLEAAGGVGVDALTLKWDNNVTQNYHFSTYGFSAVGNATNWYHDVSGGTNRIVLQFGNNQGMAEVVAYADDMVRVRWHWDGLYSKDDVGIDRAPADFGATPVSISTAPDKIIMTLPKIIVDIHTNSPFRVDVKDSAGNYLLRGYRIEYEPAYDPVIDTTYDNLRYTHTLPVGYKVKAIMHSPADEGYFGLGSEARSLNRRGRAIQMWNSDTFSWQEDWSPMYNSFPFFYGVRPGGLAYGLFFNNPARPVFRFGTQNIDGNVNQHYSFEAADGQIDYFVIGGGNQHRMPDILTRYSQLTGLPTFLPKWSLGYQQCRWSYHRQSWIEYLAQEFVNQDFPLDVLYLDLDYFDQGNPSDIDYSGGSQLHQLVFNPGGDGGGAYWPNVPGMINYSLARGVRIIPIIEPWINNTDFKWVQAAGANHFLKLIIDQFNAYQAVTPIFFGNVSWIDFTSTPARDWWKGKLLDFLNAYPFEGIWNDLNEPADAEALPRNALYWLDGRFGNDNYDSRRWHVNVKNTYCVYECSLTFEALEQKHPNRRPLVISRAGWPGIQKYALSWSGDNRAEWDASRYNIRLGNSVMISGQVNFGHDLGGFTEASTPELLTRWTQWGAINPLMRNHSMKVFNEREPFRYDSDHFNWMRDITRFRYKLMPYLYTMQWSSTQDGIPMNAPTVFFFQNDPQTFYDNETEIMLGSNVLVAPIYLQGAVNRTAYLPNAGEWYYWPNGTRYNGGQFVNVPAPMGTLPMFVRRGAIIPMGPHMNNVYQFQPNYLELRCWPATNKTDFLLYEDDGLTMAYTNGVFAKTLFASEKKSDRWVFDIGATVGSYDAYTNGTRSFHIRAHDLPLVESVTANGTSLARYGDKTVLLDSASTGWAFDTADNTLYVKVPETGATNRIEAVFKSGWTPITPSSFASSYNTMAVSANFNGWNTAARNMRLVGNHVWAGVFSVTNYNNARFKFAANDTWNTRWGDSSQSNQNVPISETGSAGGDGSSDIRVAGTMNGLYSFRFNEITLEYSVRLAGSTDSDGDGMNDGWEVAQGLNPLEAQDAALDLNFDGLTNLESYQLGGDPLKIDTDGDSFTDLQEAIAGTTLTNPASVFVWKNIAGGPNLLLQWPGLTGRTYNVYYRPGASGSLLPLPGATNLAGVAGTMTATDSAPADGVRFYRLEVKRP